MIGLHRWVSRHFSNHFCPVENTNIVVFIVILHGRIRIFDQKNRVIGFFGGGGGGIFGSYLIAAEYIDSVEIEILISSMTTHN